MIMVEAYPIYKQPHSLTVKLLTPGTNEIFLAIISEECNYIFIAILLDSRYHGLLRPKLQNKLELP